MAKLQQISRIILFIGSIVPAKICLPGIFFSKFSENRKQIDYEPRTER